MARMTAVAMLLPGLLLALLAAAIASIAVVRIIMPLGRECAIHLLVLYSALATLGSLLWGMGVTHTQVRAWVHQQGLAVTAGLMKLKSASKRLLQPGMFSLLHSLRKRAFSGVQKVSEAVGTIAARMAGTAELSEAMEMKMRAFTMQLEETRRELEGAERRRLAEMSEMRRQVEEKADQMAVELGGHKQSTRVQLEERERELAAMQEQVNAVRGEVTTVQGEVNAVREEVIAAKGEMAEQKQSTTLQFEEAERRRVAEMRGQVEERERELAAVKGELAALRGELVEQNVLMKLDVDLQIRQSEGNQKTAWERIKSAS
ncbi:unnamed protein product [Closterium sp. NIES-65]|nr:unnamed protein product [Closterium sp. NIES-65]